MPLSTGDPTPAAPPFGQHLVGTTVGGRYKITRILGEGGMGVVAEGYQAELDQHVAVKLMRPELAADEGLSARFLREARIAAKAKSPHLVRVFDVGRLDDGTPYLVMELLTGHDLGEELHARGPLPIAEAVDYLLQAAQGLAEIHALGVVHRDLKPSNLFLSDEGGTTTLRVLDLGISKETQLSPSASPNLTSTRHVLGTPHYMSPEQIKESRAVDLRSDIWAMGVIAYELFTGKLPFQSDTGAAGELFGMVLFTEPRRPRALRPDLPLELDGVVMRCLQRERDARFSTVADLADALALFASPEHQHRVDAIRKRIGPRRAPSVQDAGTGPTMQSVTPEVIAPVAASSGADTRPDAPPRGSAPQTAVPWSSDSSLAETPRTSSPRMVVAIAAAAVLAGGVAALLWLRSPSNVAGAGAVSPEVPTARPEPPPAVSLPPLASQAPPPPPLPSLTPVASVAPPSPARPGKATRPAGSAPRAAGAPTGTGNVDNLILDRN